MTATDFKITLAVFLGNLISLIWEIHGEKSPNSLLNEQCR
jgi:hypothetical protein